MINGFQALNTITSGLILQQLREEVTANNIVNPSVDSNGYLMNSLEQVNSTTNANISFTGANGLLSVGTGASASSITRLRSAYLDNQIQQEGMVFGYNQVFSGTGSGTNVMTSIGSILSPTPTTTLENYLSNFAAAWTALGTAPTSAADLSAVVTTGQQFAAAANDQYNQLTALQSSLTTQMGSTVTSINQYLQQLANINSQINGASGANNDGLLDARDYALDYLSQLTNFQATYNSNGTVNLWLGDLSLVDSSGAATLSVSASNYTDTGLTNIAVRSSQGSTTIPDASTEITGGKLGGELAARDVVVPTYINDINEFASSIITMTNNLTTAGYLPNTSTAGASFFTGTNAATVAVTSSVASTPALYISTEVDQNSATGQLATMLGNLPNFLAGNYMTSSSTIPTKTPLFTPVDPTLPTAAQMNPGVDLGGSFTLNGVTVSYLATDSIQTILSKINSTVPNVDAVFNYAAQKFEFFSSAPITFVGTAGDKFSWAHLESVLTSTLPINDPLASGTPLVDYGNESLNSNFNVNVPPVDGPNSLALLVQASAAALPNASGIFSVNGTQITWYNSDPSGIAGIMSSLPSTVHTVWIQATQRFSLVSSDAATSTASPISINDVAGNLSAVLWLKNSSTSIQNLSSNMLTGLSTQTDSYQSAYNTAASSLTQLNVQQDNLAGVSTTFTGSNGIATTAGQDVQTIQQQAYQDMIQFNAMLEVMSIIDQMLGSLVGVASSTSSSGIFTQQTQS